MIETFLEAYRSKGCLQPMAFYHYHVKIENPSQKVEAYKLLRSAVRKLNNTFSRGYFVMTDDKEIYTFRPIQDADLHLSVTYNREQYHLQFTLLAHENLPFDEMGRQIYGAFIRLAIFDKLRQVKYQGKRKYRVFNNQTVDTPYIMDFASPALFRQIVSKDGTVQLYRQFHFRPEVLKSGQVALRLDSCASFESVRTVYELTQQQKRPPKSLEGLDVKYTLEINYNQTGRLQFIEQKPGSEFDCREGLLAYYKRVHANVPKAMLACQNSPQDDYAVQIAGGGKYLASMVKIVFTMETLKKWDPSFLTSYGKLIKMPMPDRIALDRNFLQDIGELELVQNLSFVQDPVSANRQFQAEQFGNILLIGGHNKVFSATQQEKRVIFNPKFGFYRQPLQKNIKICFLSLSPRITVGKASQIGYYLMQYEKLSELASEVAFVKSTRQILFNDNETKLKIELEKFKEAEKPDFCFVFVPRIDVWHNRVKEILINGRYGGVRTHSQLIDDANAEMIADNGLVQYRLTQGIKMASAMMRTVSQAKYFSQNLILDAFAKMGGIPFRLKESLGGEETLFIGLDVATERASVHYPSCSIIYNGNGEYVGGYQPGKSQQGEKITDENLQRIFDDIIVPYYKKYNQYPKRVVIHRDGHASKEELEKYHKYFDALNVEILDVVNVIKSGAPKLCRKSSNTQEGIHSEYLNPLLGTCLYREKPAFGFLISTDPRQGTPRTLRLERAEGETSMRQLAYEVYCLTKISCSSLHNRFLPVTTGDADKMCKASDYMIKDELVFTLDYL